jgi:uridylate kinase
VLANEHSLVMHLFDVAAAGAMGAICQGQDVGTRISAGDPPGPAASG